jgi:hypothetical protein
MIIELKCFAEMKKQYEDDEGLETKMAQRIDFNAGDV